MPEELLDAVNAEECETEAWEVSMPHPLERWHRALEEGRVSHASRKLATADKQQFIKAKLRSRVVYDRKTESLRLETPKASAPGLPSDVEQKFRKLADQWRKETRRLSSVTQMALHPAYQKIIGMGWSAVPLILREMQENGGHWLWALHAITDEDPAAEGATFREAVQAWLEWGKSRRYLA